MLTRFADVAAGHAKHPRSMVAAKRLTEVFFCFAIITLISAKVLPSPLPAPPTPLPSKTTDEGSRTQSDGIPRAPQTGPETETRFPPLKVPEGFKATLFACDPLIEYPSAIALGPKPGSIFVAIDYMTGLGTEIVRRDEIRLIEDTDGDGYADKSTVYATGFNSIEGLTFHDGVVYAMHSPLLTALRDTDGDGIADERRDLLTGLGLPPEENPPRLHCANGTVWGYDGWLYLALGDHGCNVLRPEGDRLILEGGGILRCRTDGRDLHVFSTGLRNIYDVALDEDLNVFVRDNENDGGEYKIRVCHSFFGANHGYPYLYYERLAEALPPLADLGLGSSAGGVAYLENQFPAEYRGNLFFCEWGRAVVRYVPVRSGAGFAPLKEIEFASGAPNDPYGFKPTDLVVERDGSLVVSDWADGQRPKRGRGRIYRISHISHAVAQADGAKSAPSVELLPAKRGLQDLVEQLGSPSYAKRVEAQVELERRGDIGVAAVLAALRENKLMIRGQLHAVWVLAHSNAPDLAQLLGLDSQGVLRDARVRVQVIRALTDLNDPAFATSRSDSVASATRFGQQIENHRTAEPIVQLERLNSMARLGNVSLSLVESTLSEAEDDVTLAHAAQQTLRRADWRPLLNDLDRRARIPIRFITLRALADRAEDHLVEGLIALVLREGEAARRLEYADLLARVYKKPGPWTYWGYRPPPRPPNTIEWAMTAQIKEALNHTLLDPDRSVRLAVLQRMEREKIPTDPKMLALWLADERDGQRVDAILTNLKSHSVSNARELLQAVLAEPAHTTANRLTALKQIVSGLDATSDKCLIDLALAVEDGPVLAAVLDQMGIRPKLDAGAMLVRKTASASADVRAASVRALGQLQWQGVHEPVRSLFDDSDARVRREAVVAAAKLSMTSVADSLLKLANDPEATVRAASLDSLRALHDARAITAAVNDLRLPEAQTASLAYISEFGSPEYSQSIVEVARRNPSAEVLLPAVSILTRWAIDERLSEETRASMNGAVADLQGVSGSFVRWCVQGRVSKDLAEQIVNRSSPPAPLFSLAEASDWHTELASGSDATFALRISSPEDGGPDCVWYAMSDVWVSSNTDAQFLASCDGGLRVWLNGSKVYERSQTGAFQPDSDRFKATLAPGPNRVFLQISGTRSPIFHLRFRPVSSRAEHEQLVQAALNRAGDAERGGKLFFDAAKSQCIKCHRLGDQGERIGPELTGIGNRFSRVYIVESILEPSRTLAPSFESVTLALKDGRVVTGLRVAESDSTLTLVDNQAAKHVIEKSEIEEQRAQPTSIMPDGLEKQFTTDEFVDLITFLVSQKGPTQ